MDIKLKVCMKIDCKQFPLIDTREDYQSHSEHLHQLHDYQQLCNFVKEKGMIEISENDLQLINQYPSIKSQQSNLKHAYNLYHEFRREKQKFLEFIKVRKKQLETSTKEELPLFKSVFSFLRKFQDGFKIENQSALKVRKILRFIEQSRQRNNPAFQIKSGINDLSTNVKEFVQMFKNQFIILRSPQNSLFQLLARLQKRAQKRENELNYELEQKVNDEKNLKRQKSVYQQVEEEQVQDLQLDEKQPVYIYTGQFRKFQVFTQQEKIKILVECLLSPHLQLISQKYNIGRKTITYWKKRYLNKSLDIVQSKNIFYFKRKGWQRTLQIDNEDKSQKLQSQKR